MTRVQWMMYAVAAVAFAAGFGTARAVPSLAAVLGEPEAESPAQFFARTFIERFDEQFDLRPDQVRDLRAILLQFYNDEVSIATNGARQQKPHEEIRREIMQAQRLMDERIQWILDEDQRKLYRRSLAVQFDGVSEPEPTGQKQD